MDDLSFVGFSELYVQTHSTKHQANESVRLFMFLIRFFSSVLPVKAKKEGGQQEGGVMGKKEVGAEPLTHC